MNNPSLDKLRNQIQDRRTRDYFDEVLSCYYSGNYRSAIVMLYSTVICDLVYKLNELASIYSDNGATQILNDIKSMQQANPTSADWENKLPEKCRDARKIIDIPEYNNIDALHKLRHLCAHPVLNGSQELYRPNTETMLCHIVNMLEGVLTRPAFHTGKLFDMFLDDLEKSQSLFVDDVKFNSYVSTMYLDKMNSDDMEYYFFKSLWKLVFKLDDQKCKDNREVNFKALMLLAKRHKELFADRAEQERAYFGKNIEVKKSRRLVYAIQLFNYYPKLYEILEDPVKLTLTSFVDSDQDLKAMSIFKVANPVAHIFAEKVESIFNAKYLFSYLKEVAGESVALDFNVKYYSEASSYNGGDMRFENLIMPYIAKFNKQQLENIIKATNENGQIHGRRKAKSDNTEVYNRMQELDPAFDFTPYRWFEHF